MTGARSAWGYGLATMTDAGAVLDTWYPAPALGRGPPRRRGLRHPARAQLARGHRPAAGRADPGRAGRDRPRRCPGRPPRTPTCACTCSRTGWSSRTRSTSTASSASWPTWCGRAPARARSTASSAPGCGCAPTGRSRCYGVDKFPRMVDYVLPTGVRIADADRVRLGAHLAAGTTVMHEGFVNYNAGTLGHVDGRGPHLGRRRRRRRLRRRRRRIDHGHPVRRRHPGHPDRQALPDRRQRRRRHLARRRLRRRGRALRHGRHQAARRSRRRPSRSRRASCPAGRDCCSGATR